MYRFLCDQGQVYFLSTIGAFIFAIYTQLAPFIKFIKFFPWLLSSETSELA